MTTYVFNISIIPANFAGTVSIRDISVEKAQQYLSKPFVSSVGHEGTAIVLSRILGINITQNRINTQIFAGDRVIAFQLLQRIPEGVILSEEELLKLEYKFRIMEFFSHTR